MNSKFIFIIAFFAIFLGIASMTGVFSSKRPSSDVKVKKVEPAHITFYTTRQTLRVGQSIGDDSLIKQQMAPAQAMKQYGISSNQPVHLFKDMVARRNIDAGHIVLQHDFSTPQSRDYLTLITPKYKTAYPLLFNREQLDAMKIHANEFVDVMLLSSPLKVGPVRQDTLIQRKQLTVSSLFKHIKVLMIHHKEGQIAQVSVMLGLSQAQIAKAILAQKVGQLYIFRSSSSVTSSENGLKNNMTMSDVVPGYVAVKELRGESVSVVNTSEAR